MRIQSELCHIDERISVVKVSAWMDTKLLGSSLGEARNSEEAEDRAIERLIARLSNKEKKEINNKERLVSNNLNGRDIELTEHSLELRLKNNIVNNLDVDNEDKKQGITEPEDWSVELASLDLEFKRLNWSRNEEEIYLKRTFGSPSRHKITTYKNLLSLLNQLKKIEPNVSPSTALIPSDRDFLMQKSDQILKELNWDIAKARDFLNNEMNCLSRETLDDSKLSKFISLLQEQLTGKELEAE